MSPRQSLSQTLVLLSLLVLTVGCGGGDRPPIGEVSGTVTLNGEPVEGVQVMFEPVAKGRSSSAMTDAQGHYVLDYIGDTQGAIVGEHVVRLVTARGATRDDSGRVTDPGVKEKFPPEYNSESTQKVTVESGDNVIDFDVVTP